RRAVSRFPASGSRTRALSTRAPENTKPPGRDAPTAASTASEGLLALDLQERVADGLAEVLLAHAHRHLLLGHHGRVEHPRRVEDVQQVRHRGRGLGPDGTEAVGRLLADVPVLVVADGVDQRGHTLRPKAGQVSRGFAPYAGASASGHEDLAERADIRLRDRRRWRRSLQVFLGDGLVLLEALDVQLEAGIRASRRGALVVVLARLGGVLLEEVRPADRVVRLGRRRGVDL